MRSLVIAALVSLAAPAAGPRDGQHDFDFEIGTWRTHLKRLAHPLSGSMIWAEYDGTSVVRSVWGGRANLVELEVDGAQGHIQGLSLRFYNPDARQWTLTYSNSRSGTVSPPVYGEFRAGRGVLFGQDMLGPRAILVRFVITQISPDSIRFEQAFSDDGGNTWERNWIAEDTREKLAKAVQAIRDYFRHTYGDKTAEEAFSDGSAAVTNSQQARSSSQPADPYDFTRPKRGWRINPYPTDPSKFWGPEPEE
jgi:hypothetical protein